MTGRRMALPRYLYRCCKEGCGLATMTDAFEVLRIDSLEDERLDAYVRLTERELRCVLEPQKGIFIAESAKVIERAVRAGYEPVSFLLGERWLD